MRWLASDEKPVRDLSVEFFYPREKSCIVKRFCFIPYAKDLDFETLNADASALVKQLVEVTASVLETRLSLEKGVSPERLFAPHESEVKTRVISLYDASGTTQVGYLSATSPWFLYFQELGDFERARLSYDLDGSAIQSPGKREALRLAFSMLKFG